MKILQMDNVNRLTGANFGAKCKVAAPDQFTHWLYGQQPDLRRKWQYPDYEPQGYKVKWFRHQ